MFFKITPSEPPIPFSLFTFLQKGTKPKCLLRKRYPEARVPLESIFPPPPHRTKGPPCPLHWSPAASCLVPRPLRLTVTLQG